MRHDESILPLSWSVKPWNHFRGSWGSKSCGNFWSNMSEFPGCSYWITCWIGSKFVVGVELQNNLQFLGESLNVESCCFLVNSIVLWIWYRKILQWKRPADCGPEGFLTKAIQTLPWVVSGVHLCMEPWFSLEGTGGRNFRHARAGICPPKIHAYNLKNDGLADVSPFLEDAAHQFQIWDY